MWFKKPNFKKLPIYRKVLLFSFFISFTVVLSFASFIFVLETKQLKDQLTSQARSVASLWSKTISPEDVRITMELKDSENAAAKRLNNLISMINENNTKYLGAYVMAPKVYKNNQLFVVAAPKIYEDMGFKSYSMYKAKKTYLNGISSSVRNKRVTNSGLYRDQYGLWITAFAPITDGNGKVIAALAVDVNASKIDSYKWRISLYLFLLFLAINIGVYLTLRWGLKKAFIPINEIIAGMTAVSAGNFNVKLNIKEQPDLINLGEQFNTMTEQLSQLFQKLSDTYREFASGPKNQLKIHPIEDAIDDMEHIIEKNRLQKELQRAEKMNAIGQLAASVAHEIRNPMTVVKGFLQLFLAKDHLSEEEHLFLKLMIDELNRAEMIINDYLSLARPDLERTEKVDGIGLGVKVMDLMNTYALMSKGVEMKTYFPEPIYLKGIKSEIQQVLINILKNAVEAMGEGGILTLSAKTDNGYGIYEISDTGVGMSEDEISRLGTPFYSLKEKGTGIGLMVCYQIIERMKGRIEVQSIKGTGTTFRIFVPLWS